MTDKKQFNLYLDEELIKRIKHAAIEAGMRLSDFVAAILVAHLEDGAPLEEKETA